MEFNKKHLFMFIACLAVIIADFAFGTDGTATLSFAAVAGTAGKGMHLTGEPLTTTKADELSPGLDQSDVDSKITLIRPSATPIDQILRYATARACQSQKAEYYSVDTKPTDSAVKTAVTAVVDSVTAVIDTNDNNIFDVSDTILCEGVKGYDEGKTVPNAEDLVLYVQKKADDGKLVVIAVNGKFISDTFKSCVPAIPAGTKLIRMGRAATELDIQTAQFESLPTKDFNFCQTFKAQVEESTFQKITKKEANWGFNDIEQNALYDMRSGIEKNFLFGSRRKFYDPLKKEHVYTCGGIWYQAGKEFTYDKVKGLDQAQLTRLLKLAFSGNTGSQKRILVGGSELTAMITNIYNDNKRIGSLETEVVFGIEFNKIKSPFGAVDYLNNEVFDRMGKPYWGMIIDIEYLVKHEFQKFGKQDLDLKTSGQRNTDAVVLTESSCATLRYPDAHVRIIGQ